MEPEPRVLRITGLPIGISPHQVKQFFVDRIRGLCEDELQVSGCHIHDHARGTACCTVTFSSMQYAGIASAFEPDHSKIGRQTLKIDHHFSLLTTMYSSNNPQTGRPDIE